MASSPCRLHEARPGLRILPTLGSTQDEAGPARPSSVEHQRPTGSGTWQRGRRCPHRVVMRGEASGAQNSTTDGGAVRARLRRGRQAARGGMKGQESCTAGPAGGHVALSGHRRRFFDWPSQEPGRYAGVFCLSFPRTRPLAKSSAGFPAPAPPNVTKYICTYLPMA